MHLELISRQTGEETNRPHLLFIHGGFHGAWCWDEHFLPWFQDHGWSAHALSLRGHGSSEGADDIRQWTLADYCEDVFGTMSRIERPVILLGHSMGGVIAQMCFANREDVAGMCLIASSPLRPAPSVVLRMLRKRPISLLLGQMLNDPVRLRRALSTFFLSPDFSKAKTDEYHSKLSLESPKALQEIFSRTAPVVSDTETRPVHIIAGKDDWSIPISEHEKLAQTYRASFDECSGAHGLMLDPHWQESANAILNWLGRSFP